MNSDYSYPIEQCDVAIEKRAALQSYRDKRLIWLSWINTDEHHAISPLLSSMAWSDVSFRMLGHLANNDENNALHNRLLSDALIDGHLATQVLAIRRLMDKSKNGNISLIKLIKDLKRSFKLITRENFVCHDGLPYDYGAVYQRVAEANRGKGVFWGATTGPEAYDSSQMAHQQFDKFVGVSAENRSRQDQLPLSLLETIESWLDNSDANKLTEWSHVFLAHAGDLKERSKVSYHAVTLDKITKVVRIFARVTEAISWLIYSGGLTNTLMPVALFDQFEKLDNPIIPVKFGDEAEKIWNQLSSERNQYLDNLELDLKFV